MQNYIRIIKVYLPVVLAVAILCGCGRENKTIKDDVVDTIPFRYAEFVRMADCGDYIHADIINPWKPSSVLHSYDLGKDVKMPVKKIISYASMHSALISELAPETELYDFSNQATPDIEQIISISPDAILLSPFENSGGYGQVEQLGIPIVECADYMESTPLARAEWILFYGILLGKEEKAREIFRQIENDYIALKDLVSHNDIENISVICDLVTGSTWYVPGGNSTMGNLISDAGGDYIFKDRKEKGSLALSPESVFEEAQNADVWFIRYTQNSDKRYDELIQEYAPYGKMKAYRERNIYGCNFNEGDRFFRETAFHPERLLKDMIKMFYPDLLPEYELQYFKPLK